jgi:hypothetical protein
MARITYSPVVTGASGAAGDAVFSSWKGRGYIRKRVVPHNPQTEAQMAQRDAMTEAVALWQSLDSTLQDGYTKGAVQLQISGYNDFVARNVVAIKNATGLYGPRQNLQATEPRLEVPPDVTATPGSSKIDLSWSDTEQGSGYYIGVLVYDSQTNLISQYKPDAALVSAKSYSITGLTAGHKYLIAAFVYRAQDSEFRHAAALSATPT